MILQRSSVYKAKRQLQSKPRKSIQQHSAAWATRCHGSSGAHSVELLILVKGSNLVVNTALRPGQQLTDVIRMYVFHQLQN